MIVSFIYPFIFSLFPVLSLYLGNYNEVGFTEVLLTCLLMIFYTASLFVSGLIVSRNTHKASLLTFIFLFFIFSFGPILSPIKSTMSFEQVSVFYPKYFQFWILAFSLSVVAVFLSGGRPVTANKFLAFVSTFLLLSSVARLVSLKPWSRVEVLGNSTDTRGELQDHELLSQTNLPDIYYIIMDRYLGDDVLLKNYGFDSTPFYDFLRSYGFYVVESARANYLKTAHSLASSLNMDYINYLSQDVGESSSDWLPLYSLIEENKVAKLLKSKGYTYIHIGSWWEPTRKSSIADVNVNSSTMSEFSHNLFKNTVLYPFQDQLFSDSVRMEQMDRSLYEMTYLKSISLDDKPTYTFAHFLITHPPYVFDEDGKYLRGQDTEDLSEKDIYLKQIKYANYLLEDLVSDILAKSETKPVIIIQSDEGKYPVDRVQYDHTYDWFEARTELADEKFSILNAIYLPEASNGDFYPEITPVNTFRVVFNKIFKADLDILPDESFLHQNNFNLYKFRKFD